MSSKQFAFENMAKLIRSALNLPGKINQEHILYPAWTKGDERVVDLIGNMKPFKSGPWIAEEDLENDCVYVISTQF